MKAFTLRWIDVAAFAAWVVCGSVTAAGVHGSREVCAIAVILAVIATAISFAGWLSRKLEELENHVYTEGLRAGFQAKQVVRLPEQR